MSFPRPLLSLPLLAALLACDGSHVASVETAPPTRLEQDSLALNRVDEVVEVRASVGGVAAERVTLTVEREARWIADRAVLDVEALAGGEVRAAAPGVAVLAVRAPGAEPARLVVTFRPARPRVTEVRAEGERTVTLHGYRLDAASTEHLEIDGRAVDVVARDSARIRATLRAESPAACSEAPASTRISLPGVEIDARAAFPALGVEEVRLGVGQRATLPAGASRCIRFAREAGAAYAVTFLDTRFLAAAETGYEGAASEGSNYVVTMGEVGSALPAPATSTGASASRAAAGGQPHRTMAAPTDDPLSPFRRSTAWRSGERIVLRDAAIGGEVTARVAAVHGRLVLAVTEDDAGSAATAEWVARADSAMRWMAGQGVPLLRGALGDADPVTSTAAGQFLVLARPGNAVVAGSSVTVVQDGRSLSLATLSTRQGVSAMGILRTLAHELGHAWQVVYDERTRPAGTPRPAVAPRWASEGSADLLAGLVVRRVLGMGLLANWDWAPSLSSRHERPYAHLAASVRGDLTVGYASAAAFQLDLVVRLVRHGVGEDDAVAEVVRGVLEGWHGHDAAGLRRAGLTARMRRLLGSSWEPGDALLLWTAAQAVDDLTLTPELQNPTFRAVSSSGHAQAAGWLPQAVLHTGGTAVAGHASSAAFVRDNAATLPWHAGSPNYFLVEDRGRGGTYLLRSTWNGLPLERTAWMVVRYR